MKKTLLIRTVLLLLLFSLTATAASCVAVPQKTNEKGESSSSLFGLSDSSASHSDVSPSAGSTPASENSSSALPPSLSLTESGSSEEPGDGALYGVYLGVNGYGGDGVNSENKDSFTYRFFISGSERVFTMDNRPGADEKNTYALQNLLYEGALYRLEEENGKITALFPAENEKGAIICTVNENGQTAANGQPVALPSQAQIYRVERAPGGASVKEDSLKSGDRLICLTGAREVYVSPLFSGAQALDTGAEAGKRTVGNLLKTAASAAGKVLYVYGGGWNWQDEVASPEASSIGVASSWVSFFDEQTASYNYKDPAPEKSYYPFGAYNEYYYAGLDCSGYLGWALYNVLNDKSGEAGMVYGSTSLASRLAEAGYGSFHKGITAPESNVVGAFTPGSVISIKGHVYLVVGTCADGSVVILHSSPSKSREDAPGGGVQIAAIGSSRDCEAYKLADRYMEKYCPEWYARYPAMLCAPETYYSSATEKAGVFTFDVSGKEGGFSDPEGITGKSPQEILDYIFS